MEISFDPVKRAETLKHRGLDFADAGKVFAGRTVTVRDVRRGYGEDRFITAGHVARSRAQEHDAGRCVVLVWTPRDGSRRIISMRYAHAHEEARWFR